MSGPHELVVGGITVQVYGLQHLPAASTSATASTGIAVLFWLHGRFGSAADPRIGEWANQFIEYARREKKSASGVNAKSLLVVSFDHRNHGQRIVDEKRNSGWKDRKQISQVENQSHAADMVAIQLGTQRDISFLIDVLEPILWPNGEYAVTDWWCAGISLGGHSTWLSLAHDPRISLGIPIIGSPNTMKLLSHRAKNLPEPIGPLPLEAPYFPQSLVRLLENVDPVNVNHTIWKGRKIFVLSGEDDTLVNFVHGGTEEFVKTLSGPDGVGEQGVLEVWVQPGVGHKFSVEMAERASKFLWEQGLRENSADQANM